MSLAPGWEHSLTAARIVGDRLRADYTSAADMVRRRYPDIFLLMRLGVPAEIQPHLVAFASFCVQGDALVDLPVGERDPARFHAWADQVRSALATGTAEEPYLRAFLHTFAVCRVSHGDVLAHLRGQAVHLYVTGYATEQEYYDDLARVVMTTARFIAAIWGTEVSAAEERLTWLVIDAAQRVDDLVDLAEDLRDGRLTIPQTELLRFGVTRADLEAARDTPAVRALIAHRAAKARVLLREIRTRLHHARQPMKLCYQCMVLYYDQHLDAAERRGAAIDRGLLRYLRPRPAALGKGVTDILLSRLIVGATAAARNRA
ncbi:phytoene/squalene synthase family protein [Actinomadura miaoliensis]|uniref:Phytoene synthase n=1 Tax=Actinomadura miaoliensis TaxID=430685 RepID=A0ABP7VLT5_9ACTN